MATVNIDEAKTQRSKLVDQAAAGEDILIASSGKPVAGLTTLKPEKLPLQMGLMEGKVSIADDFDAPLPDDTFASFEGR